MKSTYWAQAHLFLLIEDRIEQIVPYGDPTIFKRASEWLAPQAAQKELQA